MKWVMVYVLGWRTSTWLHFGVDPWKVMSEADGLREYQPIHNLLQKMMQSLSLLTSSLTLGGIYTHEG